MCLSDDDCLGAAGCVASAMMMYAHLPWLLASSLIAETVGEGRRGEGREGQDGDRVDGDREREVDGLRGNAGGRGRESKRARELYPLLMVVWCMEKEI